MLQMAQLLTVSHGKSDFQSNFSTRHLQPSGHLTDGHGWKDIVGFL